MTARAERDVETVVQWFHSESLDRSARSWLSQFEARIATLERHAERCSIAAEASDLGIELRELLFGKRHKKYRILFTIDAATVQILRVWHSARSPLTSDDISGAI